MINKLHPNLDEAAFEYENTLWEDGHNECGYCPQDIHDAFEAGAEWMAKQTKQEHPGSIIQKAKVFLDELSRTPYNNTPITEAQVIIKQLITFFENPASYDPNAINQEKPTHQDSRFVFPKFLYARTQDNKTIDVSYVPQDMTAIEYVRNDLVQQEQSDVDLEKELEKWRHDHFKGKRDGDYSGEYLERESQLDVAHHFYELGLNAKREE